MATSPSARDGLGFDAVLESELLAIEKRRRDRRRKIHGRAKESDEPAVSPGESREVRVKARELNLWGLALSGGGVRSATFNLGILQGLAKRNWLGEVDYLSTVSGGGFIGAWLSKLAHENPDFARVIRDTIDGPEADRVRHLRRMGNYLTPRAGASSLDTRIAVVTYVRNLVCNLMITVVWMVIAILLFRLLALAGDEWRLSNERVPFLSGMHPVWILTPALIVLSGLRSLGAEQPAREGVTNILKGLVTFVVAVAFMVGVVQAFFLEPPLVATRGTHVLIWLPLLVPILVVAFTLLASAAVSRLRWMPHAAEPAATLMVLASAWVAWSTISLCPDLLSGNLLSGLKVVVISLWSGAILVGALIDRLPQLGPKATILLRKVAMVAPYVFAFGLFALVSLAIDQFIGPNPRLDEMSVVFVIAVLIGLVSAVVVDINEFSLHAFYRDRIADAYLGSKLNRDVLVEDLAQSSGPYHLINATLNLSADGQLAWQERKGASFVITPSHWGYDAEVVVRERGSDPRSSEPSKGYRELQTSGVRLRTAVALSGAAACPNMGNYSSPSLAMLLTLLNVRLGCWFPNPLREHPRERAPAFALIKLVDELVGRSSSETRYVYLSDGGHFENLGIYELVRRRCGIIVACDAGTDPELGLGDLGAAIRLCRIDFGAEIDIDTSAITTRDSTGRSLAHCAFGTIVYEADTPPGILIYIKATLTGDEPSDILGYAGRHSGFPHEPLTDQFFGESQFESYRRLGLHIAESIFAKRRRDRTVAEEIASMRETWTPPSWVASEVFARHTERLQRLFDELREDRDLDFLAAQLCIEWATVVRGNAKSRPSPPPLTEAQLAKGFSLCSSAIQLMEAVYAELRLEQTHQHPDHQGWMNLFRHWGWSRMLQATWAATSATFGGRFRNFCETHFQFRSRQLLSEVSETTLNDLERDLIAHLKRQIGEAAVVVPLGLRLELPGGTCMPSTTEFGVGFAVLLGKNLVFLRIRDHLRAAGLAKKAIVFLRHKIAGVNLQCMNLEFDLVTPYRSAIRAEFKAAESKRFERMVNSVLLSPIDHSS